MLAVNCRRSLYGGILMTLVTHTGAAQDLVDVAPQAAKVEYEDARIRVVRLRLEPNASLPMHDRPARVVVPLTENHVTSTQSDGEESKVDTPAGRPAWSGRARRAITNSTAALENIIVELKNAADPAQPLAQPPSPRPPGYLEDPFHRWSFENQYVRVYEVTIPAGGTTDFHSHAYDSVFVRISGGTTSSQRKDEKWEKPSAFERGFVDYSADSQKPFTHRVRNHDTADYRVVVVQLLR